MSIFSKALEKAKALNSKLSAQIENLGIKVEALDLEDPVALKNAYAAANPIQTGRLVDVPEEDLEEFSASVVEEFLIACFGDAYDEEKSADENMDVLLQEHSESHDLLSRFATVLKRHKIEPEWLEYGKLGSAKAEDVEEALESYVKRAGANLLASHGIDPSEAPEGDVETNPVQPGKDSRELTGIDRMLNAWQDQGQPIFK